jgi:hypothetical protein
MPKTPLWEFAAMAAFIVVFCTIGIIAIQRENQPIYWLCLGSIYFGTLAWTWKP